MKADGNRLLDLLSREDLDSAAVAFLQDARDEPWVVACSGGADSVCLLWLVWFLYPEKREALVVFHFDHGVRDESAEDAMFVEDLAHSLGLTFILGSGGGLGQGSEAKLRKARLDFFHGEMEKQSFRILFQGHQLDDVAETMLMRLSRGSGTGGLAAPRPVQSVGGGNFVHVRPLLGLDRARIRDALRECGLAWREDASNDAPDFFRNRVRAKVVPSLQDAAQQDVLQAVSRSRMFLEEDDAALCAWSQEVYATLDANVGLRWPEDLPLAVVRRVLHLWLNEQGEAGRLNADAFESLLQAVVGKRKASFSLGSEKLLMLQPDCNLLDIVLQPSPPPLWEEVVLPIGAILYLPSGASLQYRISDVDESCFQKITSGRVNPARFVFLNADPEPLLVRRRRPGDRYQPLGMDCDVKLQDVLVNRKVPAVLRDHLPVVIQHQGTIMWCPGCPGPEQFKLIAPQDCALVLEYKPEGTATSSGTKSCQSA